MTNLSSSPSYVHPCLSPNVLDAFNDLFKYTSIKYDEASKAYDKWLETGKGNEDILAEASWYYETQINAVEHLIEFVKQEMNQ